MLFFKPILCAFSKLNIVKATLKEHVLVQMIVISIKLLF